MIRSGLLLTIWLLTTTAVCANEIRIAVASNFIDAARQLASGFETESGHHVVLISGATGKLYAQIRNGAPFDAFFAADVERPRLLEQESRIVAGSRFTYAIGKLILWSPRADLVDPQGQVLHSDHFRFLAVANPLLAPYGRAARQVLEHLGLQDTLRRRMVRGENIGQTFQFVKSGNAQLGFVATSQIHRDGNGGSSWKPPRTLYDPIEQQAVLLRENPATQDFLDYVRSSKAQKVIRSLGYDVP
jgi:molybdate transport system substrate-binding protein